ncbi:peptide ABC transporter substrate-binding protein [Paludibacterium paludis]|nr:peptide ABC transporter substrate-binding protein [Paludibacterium paludis]
MAAKVPAGTQLAAKQELVRNIGAEVESLDISQIESVPANHVARDLFEGLTAIDSSGKIVPGVAESWTRKDPLTWVFKLRKNARWSNGEPVTANDFVFSWQRTVDPKTASKYTIFLDFIANGSAILAGKKPVTALGIKALDAGTVEVKTAVPTPFLPDLLSNPTMAPLNKGAYLKGGKDFTKPGKLVSNGGYVLKEWVPNSRIVLEKNPNYWNASTTVITRVTFDPTESEDATFKMFKAGQLDWTDRAPSGSYAKLSKEMPKDYRVGLTIALYYMGINNTDPVMKDIRVRKALSMVIDRDVLTGKVLGEGQRPAYGLFVKGMEGAKVSAYDWSAWPMQKRIDEAKKLLAAAGYGPNRPLKFKYMYNTTDLHKKIAVFAIGEWKNKLGVQATMENQEFKVFLKTRHDGAYQVARNGWNADYNDASTFLDLLRCNSPQNDQKYCSKKVDALINQGYASNDLAKRSAVLTEAGRLAMEDYPLIPLFQYTSPRLVKSWVGGYFTSNAFERFRTSDLYIIKH